MRVLLADDERLALRRLEIFLHDQPDVEIVASCRDGEEAVDAVCAHKPDVVFLDIKMPLADGFAVAEAMPLAPAPAIVFITAYDEFALRAFDVSAVDYLLKPVERVRLEETVDRLRKVLATRSAQDEVDQLKTVVDELRTGRRDDRPKFFCADFWVKDRDRILRISQNEIEWFEAEGDYVRLHANGRSWLLRNRLHLVNERLDPHRFLRVHRSAIVNTRSVVAVKASPSGQRVLRLASGAEVPIGRSHRSAVSNLLADKK